MEYSEIVFDYDKRGNVIKKSNGSEISSFSYNAANRIASATKSKGVTAKYTYNGLGFRVSKISENNSFDYILDQTMMYNNLLEAESKAETRDYVWCGDTLILESGQLVHTDNIGTPIRIGDDAFSYDEFGVPVFDEGNVGFTGYIQDEVSGMHFAQAREYMPEMERFAGRDIMKGMVETPQSLNEYAYCHNNPMAYVDLNGMNEKTANQSNPLGFAREYSLNQSISFGIDVGTRRISNLRKEIGYNKRIANTAQKYDTQYSTLKNQLNAERRLANNPRLGTGRLSHITRSKNREISLLTAERDVATGKVETLATKKGISAASVGKGAIIGGVVDTAVGGVEDYYAGASTSKMISNADVNFAFGSVEGALITVAFAANPILGVAAIIGVGLYEYFSNDRETLKQAINSLD